MKKEKYEKLAEYALVLVIIAFLLFIMQFIQPGITGLAVIPAGANAINLTPIAAIDNAYIDQVSPDDGNNDGTVDLSNGDTRRLNNNGDNINATAWNQSIPASLINNVTAFCEIDGVQQNSGGISFSFNNGTLWSQWLCYQPAIQNTIYSCNLFKHGVDTVTEVNNLKLRCMMRNQTQNNRGFNLDYMTLEVVYTLTTTTTSTSSSTSSSSSSTTSSTVSSSSSSSTTSSSTSTSTSIPATTSTTSSSTSISTSTSSSSSTSSSTSSSISSTSTSSTSISTSSSTSTSSSSTSISSSTTSTTTEETTIAEEPRRRRETTTIEAISSIPILTTVQEVTTSVLPATTIQIESTSTIQPTTGLFELAGQVARENIVKPEARLSIMVAAVIALLLIYYRQKIIAGRHFKKVKRQKGKYYK